MTSVDIPFKTPDEVAETISRLELIFSDRYTEEDTWYQRTVQEGQRWRNVPVMSPWPPRQPSRHNRGRRQHDNNEYRRDRRGYDERRRYSPPPPHRSHYTRHSPQHTPPRGHEGPPTHYTSLHHHSQQECTHMDEGSSNCIGEGSPLQRNSPPLEAPPTPTGGISTEESDHMTEPEKKIYDIQTLGSFGDAPPQTPPTENDLTDILSMAHGGLTMTSLKQAHPNTTHSGKHRIGEKLLQKSPKTRPSNPAFQVTHGQSMDVTTAMVFEPTNQSNRRRKRPIRDEVESSDSDVDVVGLNYENVQSKSLTVSFDRQLAGMVMSKDDYERPQFFVASSVKSPADDQASFHGNTPSVKTDQVGFHGNKPSSFAPLTSRKTAMSVLSESLGMSSGTHQQLVKIDEPVAQTVSTEESLRPDGYHDDSSSEVAKKKKKKRKKRKDKGEEMTSMVIDDGAQLKMKIKLQ